MISSLGILFGVASLLLFGSGLLAALLAGLKGYRPWFWLISMGPVGALVMMIKPALRKATTPEEREKWETRADWTGGILSGITFFFLFALPTVAVVGFVSISAPAPAVLVAPPTVTTIESSAEMLELQDVDAAAIEPAKPTDEVSPGTDAK